MLQNYSPFAQASPYATLGNFTTMAGWRILEVGVENPHFAALVRHLDAYLAVTDGDEHGFYNQYNGSTELDAVLLIEDASGTPVGCGAYRAKNADQVEIKRMFVTDRVRGQGLAAKLLTALEKHASDAGYREAVLETGLRQTSAVRLYEREGYTRIPNYPPYEEMSNSICYRKQLAK